MADAIHIEVGTRETHDTNPELPTRTYHRVRTYYFYHDLLYLIQWQNNNASSWSMSTLFFLLHRLLLNE
jgi:hypothetical protein